MERMQLSLFGLIPILTGLSVMVTCFNFDTQQPIVIQDLFDKNTSHFGASVVLVDAKDGPGWVVVGAPKADNPDSNYSRVKEPGVIWKCSLGLDNSNACNLLQVDAIGEMDVKVGKVQRKLIHKDRKDYGMLGSAMHIGASDRFVACSSRWVNQKYTDLHLMNGLCYWMMKDDLRSSNATVPDFSHRLVPLLNSTRQAYNVTRPNGVAEHRFDWAFGQAGFSIHLTKNNEVLIGAPGVLEWAGAVIEYSDAENVTRAYKRFNVKQKEPVFAQVLVSRAQSQINSKIISYFDYFGYAVTSGNFIRRNEKNTQYAVGAPRGSTLSGKVLVFTFAEEGTGEFRDSLNFLVDPLEGTSHTHFASYFGSVLGSMDVNGDGLDDLLVGAPLYEDSAPRYGTAASETNNGTAAGVDAEESDIVLNSGDEGCVFVYLSTGDDFGRDAQQICGESRPGARFGSAICPLGDINYDGFSDVAVGAPYEADGKGAVYIYIGSSKRLILSQKLNPEAPNLGIRGFGYSLSGDVDIDGNGYPDLAVGSYISNHALIYRSLAVVNVTGNLSTPVGKLKSATGIFPVTSCLQFKGRRVPVILDIWIKLSVDTEVRKTRIVEFKPDSRIIDENYSRGIVTFRGSYQDTGTCYTFNVTTVGDLDLVTLPVTIRQEFWLDAKEDGFSPLVYEIRKDANGNAIPSTFPHPTNPQFTDLTRQQPLLSPMAKGTSWKTLSIPIAAVCEEDGDPNCLADLSLKASFRTPEGDFYEPDEKFVIGSAKSLILQVELLNSREKANLPLTVDMSWQSPPTLRNSRSDCRKVVEGNEGIEQQYSCSLSTPLSIGKKELVELELDMSGIYAEAAESNITFHVTANTSSALLSDPKIEVQLPLIRRAQLLILGQTTEASYYDNITAETLNFTHVFEVGLIGQSPITGIQMTIAIPAALRIEGKRVPLLRIREPMTNYEGGKITCNPLNGSFYMDPTRISYLDQDDLRRRKRDTSKKSKTNSRKKSNVKKPLKLSCLTPGVECFHVRCEALNFRPVYRALVEFRLRLLTDTARLLFSEQEREVVVLESLAKVSMLGSPPGAEQSAVSQTLVRAELPSEVKAWILILASGGGLVLLSLIIILLTQCGFFRRHKLEELHALMAQQEVNEHFLVDDELDEEFYDYGGGGQMSGSSMDFDYLDHHQLTYDDGGDIYDEID